MLNRSVRSFFRVVDNFKIFSLIMYGISLLINIFPISSLIVNGSIISYVVDRNDNVLVGVPNRLVLIGILIGNLVGSTKLYVLRPTLYAVGVIPEDAVVVDVEVVAGRMTGAIQNFGPAFFAVRDFLSR